MIDVHCHILYGVDDGAENFEEAFDMAKLAAQSGITEIIATPHANIPGVPYEDSRDVLFERVDSLNKAFVQEGVNLKLYPGCEIFGAGDFIKLLKSGKLLTLNSSDYALVEFDFFEHPASVFMKLEELRSEGFIPIVAHPERYAFVEEDERAIDILKSIGCLIQCNKGSLVGRFGKTAKLISHEMLVRGQVDFIASDAHGSKMRTPIMDDIYEKVCSLYGKDYAKALFYDNPKKVIDNQKI